MAADEYLERPIRARLVRADDEARSSFSDLRKLSLARVPSLERSISWARTGRSFRPRRHRSVRVYWSATRAIGTVNALLSSVGPLGTAAASSLPCGNGRKGRSAELEAQAEDRDASGRHTEVD